LESNNIVEQEKGTAQRLKGELESWKYYREWKSGHNMPKDKKIPDDIREHLRSLGYL